MTIQLLDYTSGTKQVMGYVTMRGARIIFEGEIPNRIRAMLDELLDLADSPDQFLETLPFKLSGSYLRAEIV